MSVEDRELASRKATLAGLEYFNVGFEDSCLPDEPTLQGALEWLRERHGKGKSCLVHCQAGKSRSPSWCASTSSPSWDGIWRERCAMWSPAARRPSPPGSTWTTCAGRHRMEAKRQRLIAEIADSAAS